MVIVGDEVRTSPRWNGRWPVIAWEIARASAFVAFACYTLVVAWGIGLSGRIWKPPAAQLGFHRFLSSLGLVAVGSHWCR